MVNEFALKYNLNSILVIHSIKENSNILEGYEGFEKLQKNKDNILTANSDYEILLKKNLVYINELLIAKNSLLKVLDTIKADENIKEDFINSLSDKNLSSQEKPVLLKEFESKISQMVEENQIVSINNKINKTPK